MDTIECLFGEIKRYSHKMATAFRNENDCLLMVRGAIRSTKPRKIPMLKGRSQIFRATRCMS